MPQVKLHNEEAVLVNQKHAVNGLTTLQQYSTRYIGNLQHPSGPFLAEGSLSKPNSVLDTHFPLFIHMDERNFPE